MSAVTSPLTVASKVSDSHLDRAAYLYVRQSTLRQVLNNTESTERQYALRQRAIALGWPVERIVVIDQDRVQSAASAADREGFQRLVADVGLGKAGLIPNPDRLQDHRGVRTTARRYEARSLCLGAGAG